MDAKSFYKLIRNSYKDQLKSNRDKIRDFRDCLDKLFKTDDKTPLKSQARLYFQNNPEASSYKYQILNLIDDLNPYHHGKTLGLEPENDVVAKFYYRLLDTIKCVTGEMVPKEEKSPFKIENHLDKLTDEQKDTVLDMSQIIYVEAGPGTGKTYLLINKIINYILESKKSGVLERIVALSFTNTAANELGKKFGMVSWLLTLDNCNFDFTASTIHSFCYSCLKRYAKLKETNELDYSIIDDSDIEDLANEIQQELGVSIEVETIKKILQNKKVPDEVANERVREVKDRYKVISIDEILTKFKERLATDNDFREWLKCQVSILLIDEAQDLNRQTFDIVEGIYKAIPQLRIFLVGDPRQNIFSFIGGSEHNLLKFLNNHQGEVSQHVLTRSFRCPQVILDYVNTLVFANIHNTPLHSNQYVPDANIIIKHCEDIYKETAVALQFIKKHVINGNELNYEECKRISVLSLRLETLKPLACSLNENGIPFKSFGGKTFMKKDIKMLMHVLRVIDTNSKYGQKRLIKFDKDLKFEDTKIGQDITLWKKKYNQQPLSLSEMLTLIIKSDSFKSLLDDEPKDVFQWLIESSKSYNDISSFLFAITTQKKVFDFCYQRDFDVQSKSDTDKGYVTLSTIHSAKGLEWEYVIIPQMSDDVFPNSWSCNGGREHNSTTMEERLKKYNDKVKELYVAVTRTKKILFITYPQNKFYRGVKFPQYPSRYLLPILSDQERQDVYDKLGFPVQYDLDETEQTNKEQKKDNVINEVIKYPFVIPEERQIGSLRQIGRVDPRHLDFLSNNGRRGKKKK